MSDGNNIKQNWSSHPARERPGMAALGVALILAIVAVVYFNFGLGWALGSLTLLMVSLNRFYLPSRFEIDDEGIRARFAFRKQRLKWRDVRRFVHDRHGGYLATRARASRLDAYRGMHILFGSQRDTVVARIQQQLRLQNDAADDAAANCQSSQPDESPGATIVDVQSRNPAGAAT